jgi:nitronate monooxygenase
MWRDRRILDLFGIAQPLLLAPMAGSGGPDLAVAVARAGGLASLPCALLSPDGIAEAVGAVRKATGGSVNLNFFCHTLPAADDPRIKSWAERIAARYGAPPAPPAGPVRRPFDEAACAVVETLRPEVASFHFGLPEAPLLDRVKAAGTRVIGSATTVAEARWLAERGVDAVIAQGAEAGGHRGMFLSEWVAGQMGTAALVPLVADAVPVPVIAAGGIADGRGMAAALMLGASAVQVGTAFLRSPEALTAPLHRKALATAGADDTVITNVLTGRPARGIRTRFIAEMGPMNPDAAPFPLAADAVAALRKAHEADGSIDFSPAWAGQAFALAREEAAGDIASRILSEARALLNA